MKNEWTNILEQLSHASGISGREGKVASQISAIVSPWVSSTRINQLGSLVAIKQGEGPTRPRLMISTHIDEVGFVVSAFESRGFLRMEPRGGVDPKILPGQILHIHGKNITLPAVVCTIPPHLLLEEERKKVLPYEKILLDTGLSENELSKQICIGDPITFAPSFQALAGKRFSGKSLDNRASALAAIEFLSKLQHIRHFWDICCVFSSQEEVGAIGAKTSAYELQPSCAIAIDVTFGDQPDLQEASTYCLGKGLPLGIGPNFSKPLMKLIQSAAEEEGITTVLEPMPYPRGTDASSIQTIGEGIPTALISLPLRYMHSTVELVEEKDIHHIARLMVSVLRKLDMEHREGFKWS